jgi:hypothetical protein
MVDTAHTYIPQHLTRCIISEASRELLREVRASLTNDALAGRVLELQLAIDAAIEQRR